MHRWASINCKWDLGFKTILSAHFKLSHIKYQIGPSPLNELIPNHFILLISKSLFLNYFKIHINYQKLSLKIHINYQNSMIEIEA